MSVTYAQRGRGRSISQPTQGEEIPSINEHYDFVYKTFKSNLNDMEKILLFLRSRLAAEDNYIMALSKLKKPAIFEGESDTYKQDTTLQSAMRFYWNNMNSLIDSRVRLKDSIQNEIDTISSRKFQEELTRKMYKVNLHTDNEKYIETRCNKIGKLDRAYNSKCQELKASQEGWDQQMLALAEQQQQQSLNVNDDSNEYYRNNRNSNDLSSYRLSADSDVLSTSNANSNLDYYKKGATNFFTQIKTRAMGTHPPILDQNRQISRVVKLKKDITDADMAYRKGLIDLESLRKQQMKTTQEANEQLKKTIKNKTETIQGSLQKILKTEIETLKKETMLASDAYLMANSINSDQDVQLFERVYQNKRLISPTAICYENFYLKGKCKEILFGGSLDAYAAEHQRSVPFIVTKCIAAIESMNGLQKEGVYRVSGRQSTVEYLKHEFELDEEKVNLDNKYDVFTIATVLKMYIRELESPLIDLNNHVNTPYNKNIAKEQRINTLIETISKISRAQRSTLQHIINHLARVNENSQFNKMHVQNLSVIFVPVLFHHYDATEDNCIDEWHLDDVFEDLVLNAGRVFYSADTVARENAQKQHIMKQPIQTPYSVYSEIVQDSSINMSRSMPLARGGSSSPVSPTDYHNTTLTTIIGHPIAQTQRSASLAASHMKKNQPINHKVMNHIPADTHFPPKQSHYPWPSNMHHEPSMSSPSIASSSTYNMYSNERRPSLLNKSQSETTVNRTTSKPANTQHALHIVIEPDNPIAEEVQTDTMPGKDSVKMEYSNSTPPRQDSLKKLDHRNKSVGLSDEINSSTSESKTLAESPVEKKSSKKPSVIKKQYNPSSNLLSEGDELLDDYYCFDDAVEYRIDSSIIDKSTLK